MENPTTWTARKITFRTCILFFIFHLSLSFLWYLERMLQEDGSFLIVKLIQYNGIVFENARYSTAFFHWLPAVFNWCGASLEWIIRSWSVSYDIFYFFIFLISFLWIKNVQGSLLLVLFLCLALGRDYFFPVGDYQHAILTSLPIFGIFSSSPLNPRKQLTAALVLVSISLNFHPVAVLSILFILLFEWMYAPKSSRKFLISTAVFMIAAIGLKYLLIPLGQYQAEKLSPWKSTGAYLFRPDQLQSLQAVTGYYFRYFPEVIFLFLGSLLLLWKQIKITGTLLIVVYSYCVAVLFCVIKGIYTTDIWFGEYFILAGIPALIPVTRMIVQLGSSRKYVPAIFILAATACCFYRIEIHVDYYKQRIEYAERLLETGKKYPEKRYMVSESNVPHSYVKTSWSLPFQTLLLSSFTNPDSAQSVIVLTDINCCTEMLRDSGSFLGPEWSITMFNSPRFRLNKKIFNLPEKGYRKLTTSQKDFNAPDSVLHSGTVSIHAPPSKVTASAGSVVPVILQIRNTSGRTIPALPDGDQAIYLSYRIYDADGNLASFGHPATFFETDVDDQAMMAVTIFTEGLKKGNYRVEPDLITANAGWWGIKSVFYLKLK